MAQRDYKLLADRFDAGVKTDLDYRQMPPGTLTAAYDVLANVGGDPLSVRQGWSRVGTAYASGAYTEQMIDAPFPAGSKLVSIVSNGDVYSSDEALTAKTLRGSSPGGYAPPVMYRDQLVFPTTGTPTAMSIWDGTTASIVTLGGADQPYARVLAPYKARLLAAHSTANPNRLFVSKAAAITLGGGSGNWDQTNDIYDLAGGEILQLAGLRSAAFAFHADTVTRITGTTPGAATLGGDFAFDNSFWPVGIAYNAGRAIAYWKDSVIWLDSSGVYMSDGASFSILTEQGGISKGWRYNLTSGSSLLPILGVFGDYLIVQLYDLGGTGTNTVTWYCYLPTRSWYNLTNQPYRCLAALTRKNTIGLYAGGDANEGARVLNVGNMFTTGSNNKTDGNGVGIAGGITLPLRGNTPGVSQFGRVWINYSIRDTASGNKLSVDYNVPETGALGNAGTLGVTRVDASSILPDLPSRTPLFIGKRGQTIAVSISMTNTVSKFKLYSVEVEAQPLDKYRS